MNAYFCLSLKINKYIFFQMGIMQPVPQGYPEDAWKAAWNLELLRISIQPSTCHAVDYVLGAQR